MKNKRRILGRIIACIMIIAAIFPAVFGTLKLPVKAAGQIEYTSHTINKHQLIKYDKVFPGGSWETHYYDYGDPGEDNARAVYCIESYKSSPKDNTDYWANYLADVAMKDPESYVDHALLACAVAHGPGGDLYYAGKQWWATCGQTGVNAYDNETMYVITHIAANYAYLGMSLDDITTDSPVFQGVPADYLKYFKQYMEFLGKVAAGEPTYKDPNHDWPDWVTTWSNFKVRVFLPDDNGVQKMAMFVDAEWRGIYYQPGIQINLPLIKTQDGGTGPAFPSMEGAVYGLYKSDGEEIQRITLHAEGGVNPNTAVYGKFDCYLQPGGGEEWSDTSPKPFRDDSYYIQEISAPKGYKLDTKKHWFSFKRNTESADGTEHGIMRFISDDPIFAKAGDPMGYSYDEVMPATVLEEQDNTPFTPDIRIIKNGSCNIDDEKADVSKAKYGLFDENDKLLQEISLTGTKTQGKGKFTYEITIPGTYYVKETHSPKYFDLDPTKYTFQVDLVKDELKSDHKGFVVDLTDKKKASITVKESPNKYSWSMKVVKTAETGGDFTSLNNVVYGLFKEDGTELQRVKLKGDNTGATGTFKTIVTDKAEAGKYYVQEIESVKGFRLDSSKYFFEVKVADQKLVPSTKRITVLENAATLNAVDKTEKGKFKFVKKGEDGLNIAGVRFEVYLKSALGKNDETGEYDFEKTEPVQTLTSNEKGVVSSKELDLGTYVVRETSAPSAYYLTEPFEVVIDSDLVTVELEDLTDRNVPVKIRCTKKDSGRDTVILKAGTAYEIKDSAGNNVSDRNGETKFVSDETGCILIDAELSPDTYTVTEIVPPNGYRNNSEPVLVKVDGQLNVVIENGVHIHDAEFKDTEKTGEITITKKGKTLTDIVYKKNGEDRKAEFIWEEAPLPNAAFEVRAAEEIYSPDNQGTLLRKKDEVVGTIVTGTDGSATITDLHLGKYILAETVAPVGYILDETPIAVELKDGDISVQKIVEARSKFDERQKVILDLHKYDSETGKPLANAKFGLYADEDIYNFTGRLLVKKGELLSVTRSDENGVIDFDIDLPFGSYMVKEEQAPWGYVINKDEYRFKASEPDSKTATVTYENKWGNTSVRGSVIFTKIGETLTDFKNGAFVYEEKSLAGAEFEIHAKEVYTPDQAVDGDGKRTVYYEKDALIEKITVGDDGKAEIRNYPIGTYYLIETKAPYGMKRMEKPFSFEIKYRDQDTPVVLSEESILNERQKITLSIGKLQRTSNITLDGGTFDLYTGEDIRNYAGKVIVKKDTKIASAKAMGGVVDFGLDLPHGKYYITESEGIHDHYDNDEIYQVDGTYRNQEIRNLGIDLVIYNDKKPGLGKVMMKVAGASFKKNKNNYITGDTLGSTGYSVLIGEEEDIEQGKSISKRAAVIFGIIMLFVGAVGIILIRSGNKKIVFGDEKKTYKNNRKGVKR